MTDRSDELTSERIDKIEKALATGRVDGPSAIHKHECRAWRPTGGPCTCGAEAIEECVADTLRALCRMARRSLELEEQNMQLRLHLDHGFSRKEAQRGK